MARDTLAWIFRKLCKPRQCILTLLLGYLLLVLRMVDFFPASGTHYINNKGVGSTKLKLQFHNNSLAVPPATEKTKVLRSAAIVPECSSLSSVSLEAPGVDRWQTVSNESFFVYSAYMDDRNGKSIKVISITKKRTKRDVYCQLWYGADAPPYIVSTKYIILPEQPGRVMMAAVYSCDLSKYPEDAPLPVAVSIVSQKCDSPNNLLRIHYPPKSQAPQYNFTVCLCGPLKFGLSNTNHLTEWLEMNSIFGADHFILYNHSASSNLKPYVDYYRDERGLIDWLPWQLPESINNPRDEMKNFGHLGLVHDCLYRSMYRSRHAVFMDTDEFIVPRTPVVTTWNGLLEYMGCQDAGSVIVQCVFFKKEWPDDEMFSEGDIENTFELLTQIKTKKEDKIWDHTKRSKYIIRPETVSVPGIHQIWKWQFPVKQCLAKPHEALLHHYRDWEDPDKPWLVDRHMHMYKDTLIDRINAVHSHISE